MEALEPFKVPNTPQDPTPFPYLQHKESCNFDMKLEVDIKSEFHSQIPIITILFYLTLLLTPLEQKFNFKYFVIILDIHCC